MIDINFSEILKKVGDWTSFVFTWIVDKFSALGGGKLITLIILGLVFYFSMKITIKILKIILILLIVFFFISTGYSWIFELVK